MPLYEYQCTKCRDICEVLQKAKDKPLDKCPKCGGPVVKRVSSPAIQFKGNGWYITDYPKKTGAPPDNKAESKPAAGEGAKPKTEPSSS